MQMVVKCLSLSLLIAYAQMLGQPKISVKAGQEAIKRLGKLQRGMTDIEVFKTLGLSRYALKSESYGSGPSNGWPTWYNLTPTRMLMIRWDLRKSPHTLMSYALHKAKNGQPID